MRRGLSMSRLVLGVSLWMLSMYVSGCRSVEESTGKKADQLRKDPSYLHDQTSLAPVNREMNPTLNDKRTKQVTHRAIEPIEVRDEDKCDSPDVFGIHPTGGVTDLEWNRIKQGIYYDLDWWIEGDYLLEAPLQMEREREEVNRVTKPLMEPYLLKDLESIIMTLEEFNVFINTDFIILDEKNGNQQNELFNGKNSIREWTRYKDEIIKYNYIEIVSDGVPPKLAASFSDNRNFQDRLVIMPEHVFNNVIRRRGACAHQREIQLMMESPDRIWSTPGGIPVHIRGMEYMSVGLLPGLKESVIAHHEELSKAIREMIKRFETEQVVAMDSSIPNKALSEIMSETELIGLIVGDSVPERMARTREHLGESPFFNQAAFVALAYPVVRADGTQYSPINDGPNACGRSSCQRMAFSNDITYQYAFSYALILFASTFGYEFNSDLRTFDFFINGITRTQFITIMEQVRRIIVSNASFVLNAVIDDGVTSNADYTQIMNDGFRFLVVRPDGDMRRLHISRVGVLDQIAHLRNRLGVPPL